MATGLHRSPHAAAGTAADRLAEVAPFIGKSDSEIRVLKAKMFAQKTIAAARALPGWLAKLRKQAIERSPVLFEQAREEWVEQRPIIVEKMKQAARAKAESFGIPLPSAMRQEPSAPTTAAA
jgi:hypothetical protein